MGNYISSSLTFYDTKIVVEDTGSSYNNIEVMKPRIIVVPVLRKVEETIAGIINRNEKGFKIPPVK